MPAVDTTWTRILDRLLVPGTPNVFVLGSFSRRVTVYSQQLRALNLVDALCSTGRVRKRTTVAVVGAGAGGLTAATALVRMGVKGVQLFEKEDALLPIQRHSRARFLHPHIYDWPHRRFDEARANLPILDWQAQYAADLVGLFEKHWAEVCATANVTPARFGKPVKLHVRPGVREIEHDGRRERFDIVIFAVGFGVEAPALATFPYWADLPADDPTLHTRSWIVSGSGDGALTDIMRLGFRGLKHDQILERVTSVVESDPGHTAFLRRLETGTHGAEIFQDLDLNRIAEGLPLRDTPVKVISDERRLFGTANSPPESSVLNRLVTWLLWRKGLIQFEPGRVAEFARSADYNLTVEMRNDKTGDVEVRFVTGQELLIRHGPVPPFPEPPKPKPQWIDGDVTFWRSIESLRRRWKRWTLGSESDPTLERAHWGADDFVPARLSMEFDERPAAFLRLGPASTPAEIAIENTVDAAVGALSTAYPVPSTHILTVEAAFANARGCARTIRALCEAPILVVDLTGQDGRLLLLLGVRAATRRGMTVAIVCGEMNTQRWDDLAFNLKSLKIVADPDPTGRSFEIKLTQCLREGAYRRAQRPDYLDLPVFDAIRSVGRRPKDYAPIPPEIQTIVLCPFDTGYTQVCWPEIQRAVQRAFGSKITPVADPARRALDLESPEVVDRRLYEAIRRCSICVVDITLHRPNVYFELGVRLATTTSGTVVLSLRDEDRARFWPKHVDAPGEISLLVGINRYAAQGGSDVLAAALRAPARSTFVSDSFVFNTALDAVDPETEIGGTDVATLLRDISTFAVGPDPIKDPQSPLLFGANPIVEAQARRLAFEADLARLLYLAHRKPAFEVSDLNVMQGLIQELEEFGKTVDFTADDRTHIAALVGLLRKRLEGKWPS